MKRALLCTLIAAVLLLSACTRASESTVRAPDAGAGAGVSARAAAGSGAGAGGVFVRSIYLFVLPMAFPSYISRLSCAFSGSAIAPRICVSAMTFCML